jgi:hypothetical protein
VADLVKPQEKPTKIVTKIGVELWITREIPVFATGCHKKGSLAANHSRLAVFGNIS